MLYFIVESEIRYQCISDFVRAKAVKFPPPVTTNRKDKEMMDMTKLARVIAILTLLVGMSTSVTAVYAGAGKECDTSSKAEECVKNSEAKECPKSAKAETEECVKTSEAAKCPESAKAEECAELAKGEEPNKHSVSQDAEAKCSKTQAVEENSATTTIVVADDSERHWLAKAAVAVGQACKSAVGAVVGIFS